MADATEQATRKEMAEVERNADRRVYWLVRHDPFEERRVRFSAPSETEAEAEKTARSLEMADRQVGVPTTFTVVPGPASEHHARWRELRLPADPLLPESCGCLACTRAKRRAAEAAAAEEKE